MDCILYGKNYIFTKDIRDNNDNRKSFNNLATNTFGLSFENWYQNGYWNDKYIPYILMDNGMVVANVSVNIMDCICENRNKRFIQLGTIMTDENCRNTGLSKFLMDKVLEEWLPKCDGMYLYANDSVKEFYPKFGFKKENEFQCSMPLSGAKEVAQKLNMDDTNDVNLLYEFSASINPYAKIAIKDYQGLIMFYCTQFMKDSVYYCKDYNAIIIADFKDNEMICYEIFGGNGADINEILLNAALPNTKKVSFGFAPKQTENVKASIINEDDTTFFWHTSKEFIFKDKKIMFPHLSHA